MGKYRVLTGWMTEEQGALVLAGNRLRDVTEALRQQVRISAQAVQRRPKMSPQQDVVIAAPKILDPFIKQFTGGAYGAEEFESGYTVALADLTKLISVQPYTEIVNTASFVPDLNPGDIVDLARLTLPLESKHSIPAQFDARSNTWYLTSPDTRFGITGNWTGSVREGVAGFGFGVALRPSFLRVAKINDHYILVDGYHRSLALLAKGVSVVPVLFKEFRSVGELSLRGDTFPAEVFLGERPPFITSYNENSVSHEVQLPEKRRIITIQATELTVLDPT